MLVSSKIIGLVCFPERSGLESLKWSRVNCRLGTVTLNQLPDEPAYCCRSRAPAEQHAECIDYYVGVIPVDSKLILVERFYLGERSFHIYIYRIISGNDTKNSVRTC